MNLQEHTLRVAVLSVRRNQVADELDAARAEAQEAYKLARQAGISQLRPQLPGGGDAGSLSIKQGATVVAFIDDALLRVVEESTPECVESYVEGFALRDPRVLALIAEHFPEYTGRRVIAERRKELEAAVIPTGGFLASLKTGERIQVAKVDHLDPTGEFAYTPGKPGTKAILEALKAGTITPDGRLGEPGSGVAG